MDLATIAQAPPETKRRPKRARITRHDVTNIAKLTALRLSERQACLKLDVPYQQWLNWKSRANGSVIYDTILTRMKADRLDAYLAEMEKAATGNGVRHDWRAADRMLQIIQPDVFNPRQDSQQTATPQPGLTLAQMHKVLSVMMPNHPSVKATPVVQAICDGKVIDCQPVKSLPPVLEPDECSH